jgi:uncharacterized membrane protein
MHIQSPTRTLIENTSIALAAAVLGLMAGFFWTYSYNINLAMLQVDGATYATVQSLFNRNVRHASFFALFFGGAMLPLLAAGINGRHWRTPAFWLVLAAALVYALGIVAFTRQVNLPLNAYTESWLPTQLPGDWELTRARWNAANALRVWIACSAFALALGALVLRASAGSAGAQKPEPTRPSTP